MTVLYDVLTQYQEAGNTSDADQRADLAFYNDTTYCVVGHHSVATSQYVAGVQFLVDVPIGTTVTNAYLTLTCQSSSFGYEGGTIAVEPSPTGGTFSSGSGQGPAARWASAAAAGTVTWNSPATATGVTNVATNTASFTARVNAALGHASYDPNGSGTNVITVLIRGLTQAPANYRFHSRNATTAAYRPVLNLVVSSPLIAPSVGVTGRMPGAVQRGTVPASFSVDATYGTPTFGGGGTPAAVTTVAPALTLEAGDSFVADEDRIPDGDWLTGAPDAWGTNGPFSNQTAVYEPDRVTIANGEIVLNADAEGGLPGGATISSGAVNYGFEGAGGSGTPIPMGSVVQARVRYPTVGGTFAALWMLPSDTTAQFMPEIDIAEQSYTTDTSDRQFNAIAWTGDPPDGTANVIDDRVAATPDWEWHDVRVELDWGETRIYHDDVLVNTTFTYDANITWGLMFNYSWWSIGGGPDTGNLPTHAELRNAKVTTGAFTKPDTYVLHARTQFDTDTATSYTTDTFTADNAKNHVIFVYHTNETVTPTVTTASQTWTQRATVIDKDTARRLTVFEHTAGTIPADSAQTVDFGVADPTGVAIVVVETSRTLSSWVTNFNASNATSLAVTPGGTSGEGVLSAFGVPRFRDTPELESGEPALDGSQTKVAWTAGSAPNMSLLIGRRVTADTDVSASHPDSLPWVGVTALAAAGVPAGITTTAPAVTLDVGSVDGSVAASVTTVAPAVSLAAGATAGSVAVGATTVAPVLGLSAAESYGSWVWESAITGPDGDPFIHTDGYTAFTNSIFGGTGTIVYDADDTYGPEPSLVHILTAGGDAVAVINEATNAPVMYGRFYLRRDATATGEIYLLGIWSQDSGWGGTLFCDGGDCYARDGFNTGGTYLTTPTIGEWLRVDWRFAASGTNNFTVKVSTATGGSDLIASADVTTTVKGKFSNCFIGYSTVPAAQSAQFHTAAHALSTTDYVQRFISTTTTAPTVTVAAGSSGGSVAASVTTVAPAVTLAAGAAGASTAVGVTTSAPVLGFVAGASTASVAASITTTAPVLAAATGAATGEVTPAGNVGVTTVAPALTVTAGSAGGSIAVAVTTTAPLLTLTPGMSTGEVTTTNPASVTTVAPTLALNPASIGASLSVGVTTIAPALVMAAATGAAYKVAVTTTTVAPVLGFASTANGSTPPLVAYRTPPTIRRPDFTRGARRGVTAP